ncbi:MAG TPA: 6-hydroxymethylpterin diphosphokinase MptE-like protein [Clostridium sp.]|uniref:motility associated factor glycosyltransferase family protein n=1 Tax=Clostridium sp. TaxID=1506 RepID=UPI002F93E46B
MNEINEILLEDIKKINLSAEERYIIENSKDNKKILKINKDGKFVYLGSKYTVERDIEKFNTNINKINTNSIIMVWGYGTGEHIIDLLKKSSSSNKILVIEPDEKILIENLLCNNLDIILNDDRVFLFSYKKENLKQFLSENVNQLEINNVELVTYANYDKIYGKEYKEFCESFFEFVNNTSIELITSLHFSKQFFTCFMNNIKTIVNSITINKLKNQFDGRPAIIVSAGPSLEKNICFLREVQEQFIIITGGRTLKALLDEGITPDFVCTVDPGEASYTVIKEVLHSKVPLVFSEVSNYKIVNEYSGEKIFFKDMDFADITDDLLGIEVDILKQGGSVAHVCISLAGYLGCDKIILIGQDLAYTNNKYHAESAKNNEQNSISVDEKYLYVDDIYGEKVPTTMILDFYRKNIERMVVANEHITFINSTEGGANIEGTLVMPLGESIQKYSYKEGIDKDIEYILNSDSQVNKQTVIKNIIKILKSISSIEDICKKAIVYTSRMYKHYDKNSIVDINNVITCLDKLDYKLEKELIKVKSIKKLYIPLVARVMVSEEFKERIDENGKQKGKRVALKSESMYKGLLEIVKEAKIELKKVEENLI